MHIAGLLASLGFPPMDENLHDNAVIDLRFVVPLVGHEGVKLPVPLSGSLLQSVQALRQPPNQVLLPFLHESFRFLHVDLLFEVTMKESWLHVQLLYLEIHAGCYTQHRSNGGHLYYRGKYLVEVDALLLLEPLSPRSWLCI